MPLEPINLETREDVCKLLTKLRDLKLLNFTKSDTYISVTDKQLEELYKHFVVGSDFRTYLVDLLFDLDDRELHDLGLTFILRSGPNANTLSKSVLPLFDRVAMRDAEQNKLLVHNKPLVDALLKINPNPDALLNMPPLICSQTHKPVVFPVLTVVGEKTSEGIVELKNVINKNDIISPAREAHLFTARYFIPNTELSQLQFLHYEQLAKHLKDTANKCSKATLDRFAEFVTNLDRVESLIAAFKGEFARQTIFDAKDDTCKVENKRLLESMLQNKVDKYNLLNLIATHSSKVWDKRTDLIFECIFILAIAPAFFIRGTSKMLTKEKNILKQGKESLAAVQTAQVINDFTQDQIDKLYTLIIDPSSEKIAVLKQMLNPQLAPSERVDDGIRRSNSIRFSLLPPPAPAVDGNDCILDVGYRR